MEIKEIKKLINQDVIAGIGDEEEKNNDDQN